MKLLKQMSILCVLVMFLSCGSDDENSDGSARLETDINLVTGMYATQNEFTEFIELGNPNTLFNDLTMFPNPATEALTIQRIFSLDVISDVWIVPANAERIFQNTDFTTVLNSDLYSESDISTASIETISNNESASLQINLDGYQTGYYKVFVKINDQIQWHNIYVDNNGNGMTITELMDFWN